MNLILSATLIFTNFLQAYTLGLAGKPHQQIILENTLPKEGITHKEVQSLAKRYRQQLWKNAFAISLFSLLIYFISYESIQLTLFWLLLFLNIGGQFYCKLAYIREMKQLLIKQAWEPVTEPKLIDTTLIVQKNKKMLSLQWLFLPIPLVLGLGWYTYKISNFTTTSILSGTYLFFFILMLLNYYYIGRFPVKPLTNEQKINEEYNHLTKRYWSLVTVLMNWLFIPLLFLPLFSSLIAGPISTLLIVLQIGLLLAVIFVTLFLLLQLRKKQDRLLAQTTSYRYTGEDEYWQYGVYYNPNDPRLFVPDRIGLNIGINLGHLVGKIIMTLITLLLAATIIFTLIPTYLYDFSLNPFQAKQTDTTLTFSAPFVPSATIDKETIKAISLIEELPSPMVKNFGMATNNYAVGNFTINNQKSYVLVDFHSSPILVIKTKDKTYYYTNKQPQQTQALYDALLIGN